MKPEDKCFAISETFSIRYTQAVSRCAPTKSRACQLLAERRRPQGSWAANKLLVCPAKLSSASRCESGHGNRQEFK